MLESGQMWLAVVNLHAGSGKTASLWREAENLLVKMKIKYDNKYTDYKYHAAGIAYGAASSGFRKFIAVGGDGTVHEVLEGIMRYVEESASSASPPSASSFTVFGRGCPHTRRNPLTNKGIWAMIVLACFSELQYKSEESP